MSTPIKKIVLSSKFSKFLVFGHWFIDRLAISGTIDDAHIAPLRDQLNLFSDPEIQNQMFELFFEQLKDSTKSMKSIIKLHNKPVKAKKEKTITDKKPRVKKTTDIVLDKQEQLVADIVAAAQADIPTGEKKRIIKRKPKNDTVAQPTTEPTTEPVAAQPTTQPVAQPVTAQPTTEPTTEPVTAQPTTEPTTEPVTDKPMPPAPPTSPVVKKTKKLDPDAKAAEALAKKAATALAKKAAKDAEVLAKKAAKDAEKASKKTAPKTAQPLQLDDDNDDEIHLQSFSFDDKQYLIDSLYNLYSVESVNLENFSSIGTFNPNTLQITLF